MVLEIGKFSMVLASGEGLSIALYFGGGRKGKRDRSVYTCVCTYAHEWASIHMHKRRPKSVLSGTHCYGN